MNALLFVLRTLFDLYLLTFALRLLMQWSRIESWNPLSQFIIRVTNPLVLPFRRVLPPVGGLDSATAIVLLALQMAGTTVLTRLACLGDPGLGQLLGLTVLYTADLLLRIWFWVILIYVVLSWVSPGGSNPAAAFVGALARPVLAPFRRLLPLVGGLDLSPIFAVIVLQALRMLLPIQNLLAGLLCGGVARPVL